MRTDSLHQKGIQITKTIVEMYFEDSPKRTAILVTVQLEMANCLVKLPHKVRKVVIHKVKMACFT